MGGDIKLPRAIPVPALLAMANGEHSVGEIADALAVDRSSIHYHANRLKAAGYDVRFGRKSPDYHPQRRSWAEQNCERNARIRQMIADGATYSEIGAECGVTRERIRQICAKLGIEAESSNRKARERNAAKRAEREASAAARTAEIRARVDRVAEMVLAGMSIRRACRMLGYGRGTQATILKYLREIGVESRHGPWRSDLPNPRQRGAACKHRVYDHDAVLDMWAAGATADEISAAVGGITRGCIDQIVSGARQLGDPRAVKRRLGRRPMSEAA